MDCIVTSLTNIEDDSSIFVLFVFNYVMLTNHNQFVDTTIVNVISFILQFHSNFIVMYICVDSVTTHQINAQSFSPRP